MSMITPALFEPSLFDEEFAHGSRPSIVLGESVFGKFIPTEPSLESVVAANSSELFDSTSPNMGTVSPLEIHSSLIESVFDTPELDNSPMFEEEVDLDKESKSWSSLFSEADLDFSAELSLTSDRKRSFAQVEESKETQQVVTPLATPILDLKPLAKLRKTSSTDHLGVVAYNRKQRSAPLSPIVNDESDPIASKRARNTEAARRSRARKMERMSQLESKVEDLLQKNTDLQLEVERLRGLLGY